MRALIQRVKNARVTVEGRETGSIGQGLLIFLGIRDTDSETELRWMVKKCAALRVFEDDSGRMNLALTDVGGSLLVVSQFTLFGDCRKGRRPSFVHALEPTRAEALVDHFVAEARGEGLHVETGRFRTHMQVHLCNDGPVTLLVDSKKQF